MRCRMGVILCLLTCIRTLSTFLGGIFMAIRCPPYTLGNSRSVLWYDMESNVMVGMHVHGLRLMGQGYLTCIKTLSAFLGGIFVTIRCPPYTLGNSRNVLWYDMEFNGMVGMHVHGLRLMGQG